MRGRWQRDLQPLAHGRVVRPGRVWAHTEVEIVDMEDLGCRNDYSHRSVTRGGSKGDTPKWRHPAQLGSLGCNQRKHGLAESTEDSFLYTARPRSNACMHDDMVQLNAPTPPVQRPVFRP